MDLIMKQMNGSQEVTVDYIIDDQLKSIKV